MFSVFSEPHQLINNSIEMDEAGLDLVSEKSLSASRKTLTTFPFSKASCICNCGKYDIKSIPRLFRILPEEYEYKLCEYLQLDREDKFLATLRMTLSTKEEALEWKRLFEERSLTTHVKDKTFPKVERVSIFKAQYRCQFFDRRKTKKTLPRKSKFRDCHSVLFINIKKYFKSTVDHHMPTYKTVVRLYYTHDHPLDTADVLKKRKLNEGIKERFLEMFRQGMKPKDALDKHKHELLKSLGPEKYRQVLCDGYFVPNVPKAYRLYYQIHGKGVSAKTSTKRSSRHNPNSDWIAFQDIPDATVEDENNESGEDDNAEVNGKSVKKTIDEGKDLLDIACGGTLSQSISSAGTPPESLESQVLCVGRSQTSHSENLGLQTLPICHSQTSHSENLGLQTLPICHSQTSKCCAENLEPVMLQQDTHVETLAETALNYPSIAAHNSVYTEMRSQHLMTHNLSFGDAHTGMVPFSSPQTWENFNMPNQALLAPHVSSQSNLSFQGSTQPDSHPGFVILSILPCQNGETQYTTQGIDQQSVHPVTQASVDFDLLENPQHSWSHDQSERPITVLQPQISSHDEGSNKLTSQLNSQDVGTNEGNSPKNNCNTEKNCMRKKRKMPKELNVKYVTKRWMDKRTKVEAETQNMATQVVHSILLADEAEKLKVRLLSFLSDLESKLTSDPKVFVPAVRSFLLAADLAQDDRQLATFLKDFNKTEDSVLKKFLDQKQQASESRGSQTSVTGPVVRWGKARTKSCDQISLTRKNVYKSSQLQPRQRVTKTQKGREKTVFSPQTLDVTTDCVSLSDRQTCCLGPTDRQTCCHTSTDRQTCCHTSRDRQTYCHISRDRQMCCHVPADRQICCHVSRDRQKCCHE